MRFLYFISAAALAIGCGDPAANVQQADPTPADSAAVVDTSASVADTSSGVALVPLTGTGLKFDGVYRCTVDGHQYYMRFFERGSAAFVGGSEKYDGQLAEILTIDVPSGWNQVHNCPVTQRNDSLFIRSVGMKGVINYYGQVRAEGDSVRFLRVSEINGYTNLMPYAFLPDSVWKKKK